MALYKRPNSKYWWMKFTFDGEPVQKSTKVANKRDALTVESAYRTQLALGKIGIEPKRKAPTFDEAAEDFLKWSKVEHAAVETTYNRYFFACVALKKYFGKVKTDRVKTADIEKFIAWRSSQISRKTKKPVSSGTVNFDLFLLKAIFNRLNEAKVLRDNPTQKIKKLPETQSAFHVLTETEEKRYLLACPPLLADVATVMIESGMRCGEVYALNRKDVHLDKHYLQVVKGKRQSSIRRVHLSNRARKVLSYRMKKFTGENLFPQNDVDGEKPTGSLAKLHLETIQGLGYSFRLYDCRHTFATRALEMGMNHLTLSQILGHANTKMLSRYAHPSEEHKAEAIKMMDRSKSKIRAKAV